MTNSRLNVLTHVGIKNYLHLDVEDESQDMEIEMLGLAAEQCIMNYLDTTYDELYDEWGECPESIKVAMLMVCADMYKNREATTQYTPQINPTMSALIKPYAKIA